MRKWFLIGGAGVVVGYVAVYFALDVKPTPEAEPEQPAAVAAPAGPVVLSEVVEVTDLDPLLDPLPGQPSGVPFDPIEAPELISPTVAPVPIPSAAD